MFVKTNIFISNSFQNFKKLRGVTLNFGPQHPASHGVLRLVLQLSGELIEQSDPQIGFLHRGTEKLIEFKNFLQVAPFFDRLDYTSVLTQTHAYCLAIEKILNSTTFIIIFAQIRTLFDELSRLLNHFLALSTHSLDIGNMSPLFWAFEEREKIMEFYERVSGARMHAAFYRPNSINYVGLTYDFFLDINFFSNDCFKALTEIFSLLTTNYIWRMRLIDIGSISLFDCLNYGASGPVLRGVGIKKDLRFLKSNMYSHYWFLSINGFLGRRGDSYDRFLIRMREMFESLRIVYQLLGNILVMYNNKISNKISKKNFYFDFFSIFQSLFNLENLYEFNFSKINLIEKLIYHFKKYSDGAFSIPGFVYQAVEAGKGEFGVSVLSDGSNYLYRCKIRSAAYNHLQLLSRMCQGHFFVDMITILGSQDIVFGEVDR